MKIYIITAFIFLSIVPSNAMDSQDLEAIILSIIKNDDSDKKSKVLIKQKKEKKRTDTSSEEKDIKEDKLNESNTKSGALPPDGLLFNIGIKLYNARLFENAIKKFKELKDTYPDSIYRDNAAIWSARVYLKLGKNNEALKELNDIGEDSGELPSALYYKAIIENNSLNSSKAIEYYSRISSQFPDHYLADDALISLGNILIKGKKGNQALDTFMKIIKEYPDRETVDDAYFLIGKVFEKDPVLKDYETAWQIYKVFLKKAADKSFPNFWNSPLKESVIRDLNHIELIYFRH